MIPWAWPRLDSGEPLLEDPRRVWQSAGLSGPEQKADNQEHRQAGGRPVSAVKNDHQIHDPRDTLREP